MNEESKDEKSVVGKAVKLGAVGGLAYGVHAGIGKYGAAHPEGRKVYGSYKVGGVGAEAAPNILKAIQSGPKTELLKEGLSPDALKNQVHLDNLKNGVLDRRVGKKVAGFRGKTRSIAKRVTKAL